MKDLSMLHGDPNIWYKLRTTENTIAPRVKVLEILKDGDPFHSDEEQPQNLGRRFYSRIALIELGILMDTTN